MGYTSLKTDNLSKYNFVGCFVGMFFNLSILIPLIGCTPWTISKRCLRDIYELRKLLGIIVLFNISLLRQTKHRFLFLRTRLHQNIYKFLTHTLYTPEWHKKRKIELLYQSIHHYEYFSFRTIHHRVYHKSSCCVNKQMTHKWCFSFGSPCMIYEVIFQLIVFVVWKHCYD